MNLRDSNVNRRKKSAKEFFGGAGKGPWFVVKRLQSIDEASQMHRINGVEIESH
jgi:hypothetical protein